MIERIARNKLCGVLEIYIAILIRFKHPSTGGRAGCLGLLLGVVEAVVVTHGELGTLKGRGALRQVVGVVRLIAVVLRDDHTGGVVDGRLVHDAVVHGDGGVRGDVHGVDRGIDLEALARLSLLDVVGAGLEVAGGGVARRVRHHGRDPLRAAGVRVDAVLGTRKGVQGVAVRAAGVGALLVERDLAVAEHCPDRVAHRLGTPRRATDHVTVIERVNLVDVGCDVASGDGHDVRAIAAIDSRERIVTVNGSRPAGIEAVALDHLPVWHGEVEERAAIPLRADALHIACAAHTGLHVRALCGERLHRQRAHGEHQRQKQVERLGPLEAVHELVCHFLTFLSCCSSMDATYGIC